MITCTRCGKDNQDHYKFCLGCGAKIESAGAPAPAPVAAPAPAPTFAPPPEPVPAQPVAKPQPIVEAPVVAAKAPQTAAAPVIGAGTMSAAGVISGGAPFNPLPATGPVRAVSTTMPPPSNGASPNLGAGFASVSGQIGGGPVSTPAAPVIAPAPTSDAFAGALAAPASGSDTVACPKCSKPVAANYAFCGACGYRMKPVAAAGAPAAAPQAPVQRTAFVPPVAAKTTPRGHLTLIRPDGTEGGVHPLHEGENLIGRGQGSLFDADPYLSPRHAEFSLTDEGLVVRDLRSLNGVFVKISQEEQLQSGDIFRIGQELLRFDVISPPQALEDGTEIIGTPNPGYWGRLSVIVGREVDGPAFPLFDESIQLGRERGDILFPEDGYVSGGHAQITLRGGDVFLADLGSSNGTFIRIGESRTLPAGSLLLMGQQLFRVAFR